MSTLIGVQNSHTGWELPRAMPLDESVWEAWVAKGRASDRRGSARRMKGVKWISLAGLLVIAGVWSNLAEYAAVARFVVTAGAVLVMLQHLPARKYARAALFGAVAILFNPVVPMIEFAGDGQRALVLLSAVPFVASLIGRTGRRARHG